MCNNSLFTSTNRNLSSGKMPARQSLRDCPGLIDSLVAHMQFCYDKICLDEKVLLLCYFVCPCNFIVIVYYVIKFSFFNNSF